MTTSTDLALIPTVDGEIVDGPTPLTEREAKALDKKIRAASDKLSTTSENLLNLLEKAASGQIHEALGLSSWTAWFKDAVQINVSDRFERKELAKMMSGKGMSQRAIAGALGVSQKTVDRDLDGEEAEEGATVTSLDGADRPKNKPKKDDNIEDAEEVDAPDEPMKAIDIVIAFGDEMANLYASQSELSYLTEEEKWAGARKRVTAANLNNLQEVVTALQLVVDDLMSGGE